MLDVSPASLAIAAAALALGAIAGWWLASRRATAEKSVINEGWQTQLEAKSREYKRLADQNRDLVQRVSQLQASSKDAGNRSRELSIALREALQRSDDLQRDAGRVRSELRSTLASNKRLTGTLSAREAEAAAASETLAGKERRIDSLSKELRNWQDRLPPLIARYEKRNEQALELEEALAAAKFEIGELKSRLDFGQTRVEPMPAGQVVAGADASNENLTDLPPPEATPTGASSPTTAHLLNDEPARNGSSRDDLKVIKGVGPAIEKTLNELGIFSYTQVAAMSRYDIERIANRLKGFQSRIEREDWVGQARLLSEQKAVRPAPERSEH